MTDRLTFDICTFPTVWVTLPRVERVTLPQLALGLRRFALRPKVARRAASDVARVDLAWRQWSSGQRGTSKLWRAFDAVALEAGLNGLDVEQVVEAHYEHLRLESHREAKKNLYLWSPTLYRPGADKRGSDNVAHLSCLVLDYDEGATIAEASDAWSSYFHLVHTTYSHTEVCPKFRLVVPLAAPVRAEDWPELWLWAEARSGAVVDPACKGVARAYAMPALSSPDAPRRALSRAGAILVPFGEGLVPAPSSATAVHSTPPKITFVGGNPKLRYVEHVENLDGDAESDSFDDDDFDDPAMWDAMGPTAAYSPQDTASEQTLESLVARLEAAVVRLEACPQGSLVAQLERLADLHERGHLDHAEFTAAKRTLMAPHTSTDE